MIRKCYETDGFLFSSRYREFKVQLFWEGHKNLVQSSSRFWSYYAMSKPWGRLHQFFVAFSEQLNFTSFSLLKNFHWMKNWYIPPLCIVLNLFSWADQMIQKYFPVSRRKQNTIHIINVSLVPKEGCNRGHGLSACQLVSWAADKPCPQLQPFL